MKQFMEALSNVTFTVWRGGELLGDFTTNNLGEILLVDLQPGTYLAQEKQSDDDHITVTTAQQVELPAGDGIKELVFFNDLKPGMHLIKVDSSDLSKPIANARFHFEAVDGSWGPEELTTLEDGTIDLSKLPTGAAVVTELDCPDYVIDDAQRIIELKPNETAQFVFTNSKKPSLVSDSSWPCSGWSWIRPSCFSLGKCVPRSAWPPSSTGWPGCISPASLRTAPSGRHRSLA